MSLAGLILVIASTIQFDSLNALSISLSQAEKDACLSSINTLRRLHEATPDLVWSEEVAGAAQILADRLVEVYNCSGNGCYSLDSFLISNDHDDPCYGENIYRRDSAQLPTCAMATSDWYLGLSHYNYETPTINSNTRWFTQLVWKKSVKVGFGIATIDKRNRPGVNVTFIVAKFSPKGNTYLRGQEIKEEVYGANVRPVKGDGNETLIEENDNSPSRNVSTLPKKDKDACLSSLNAFRRLHEETPDLVWNDELATIAQERAEYLAEINNNSKHVLEPEDANTYCIGENIYRNSSDELQTCGQAVSHWYNGINTYNFTSTNFSDNLISHDNLIWRNTTRWFTQLVWKDSVRVGFGMATFNNTYGSKGIYIVAKFSPKGNVFTSQKAAFFQNVHPRRNNISGATYRADFLYIFCFVLFLI